MIYDDDDTLPPPNKLEKVDSRDEGNQTNFATLPLIEFEPGDQLILVDQVGLPLTATKLDSTHFGVIVGPGGIVKQALQTEQLMPLVNPSRKAPSLQ